MKTPLQEMQSIFRFEVTIGDIRDFDGRSHDYGLHQTESACFKEAYLMYSGANRHSGINPMTEFFIDKDFLIAFIKEVLLDGDTLFIDTYAAIFLDMEEDGDFWKQWYEHYLQLKD